MKPVALAITVLAAAPLFAAEPLRDADRARLLAAMDARADHYGTLSRTIWEQAEVGYQETKSAALLAADLHAAGFDVKEGVAGIPTAFTATWGSGKPVIALLAEYDGLPGLSQEDVAEKKPRVSGAPGHGCGHNLLGAGAVFAAVAVKDFLAERKTPGTVRLYGTPAEEGGGGKIYMARAGLFDDVDVVLTWHPDDRNRADAGATLGNIAAKFRFRGAASHAADAPHRGRSALDALLLMSHAIELMREHVPADARIHYVITNGGGAPNVVPDFAEAYVYARHVDMEILDGIWARIEKCAEAAAMATETRVETELVNSVFSMLPNEALASVVDQSLRRVGGVRYTAEEEAFAEKLRATFVGTADAPPASEVQPISTATSSGSTDVGDVSWVVPTAALVTATYVPGTSGHTWQSTACAGGTVGRKGMVVAARTLALTALELFADPAKVAAARQEFQKRTAGRAYRSRVPADRKPPLDYRNR